MRKIALILGIVAVLGVGAFVFVYLPSRDDKEAPGQQALKDSRSYSAAKYALELDGTAPGYLNTADGGSAVGDVVTNGTEKHLGSTKYEEMMVGVGFSMDSGFYQWIKDSWGGNPKSKNGALATLDFDNKVQSRREFKNALLTETTFPAFDAATAKDAGFFTVKFLPGSTILVQGGGASFSGKADGKAQSWIPANFKLTVDGLDATKVNRIEPFSVKHQVAGSTTKELGKVPAGTEFSNLKIVMAADSAQGWYAWHDSFVIKGNNGQDQEKGGKLVFLSNNLQTELGFVQFYNMGISRISPQPVAAGTDSIARVVADLYVERMEFQVGAGK